MSTSSTSMPGVESKTSSGGSSRPAALSDLDTLNNLRNALSSFPEGSDERLDTMEKLAILHVARFETAAQFPSEDLNKAIDLRREICRLYPRTNPRYLNALHSLAELLQFRCYRRAPRENFIPTKEFRQTNKADLYELIVLLESVVTECPTNYSLLLRFVSMLGGACLRRGDLADIQKSARLFRQALLLCPEKNEYRHLLLLNLSESLGTLVGASKRRGAKAEIEELASISQEIVDYFADSDEARIQALHATGHWLECLCSPPLSSTNRFPDLRSLAHEILKLAPMDTSAPRYLEVASAEVQNIRSDSPGATWPGVYLLSSPWATPDEPNRTLQMTDAENTLAMIQYTRQELQEKRTASHLKNLAILLEKLVDTNHSQDLTNLSEALDLFREADLPAWGLSVQLCWFQKSGEVKHLNDLIGDSPLLVADRLLSVPLLAEALHERYVWGGQFSDLERAIGLIKEAQVHISEGREPTLPKGAILAESNALALCLNTRYACLGNVEDLEESIRISTSVDLAEAYMHQYERLGRVEDLESALGHEYDQRKHMDTDDGCYLDLRERITLCRVLVAQYERKPDPSLLERATVCVNDALTCCREGHILYPILCHSQASILAASSPDDVSKLGDAIVIEKRALDHLSPNSIHRPHFMASLGGLWNKKYNLTNLVADRSASIESIRGALSCLEPSNPLWGKYSSTLDQALGKYVKVDT